MSEDCKERLHSAHAQAQAFVGDELIALAKIHEGQKVIDIGCGFGNISSKISQIVGDSGYVTAIDPDEDNVELATDIYSNCLNLKFEASSCTEFQKGVENEFDVAFSCLALNWIPNDDKLITLERIFKCLKPGGVLAVAVAPKLPAAWKIVMNLLHKNEAADIENSVEDRLLDDVHLKALASKAGFEVDVCVTKHTPGLFFENHEINDFLSHISCVFRGYSNLDGINEEDIQKLPLPRTADGRITVEGHTVFAVMTKPVT